MGTADQQAVQVAVACLGDRQLRVTIARLVASGDQAQGRADVSAFAEPAGVFQGEDEGQCGQGTDGGDRLQAERVGIALAAEGLDLLIEGSDALQQRRQRTAQGLRDGRGDLGGEDMGRAGGETSAGGLGRSTGVVDDQGTGMGEGIPRPRDGQICLCLGRAVVNGRQQCWIQTRQPGQRLGIDPVAFGGLW